AREKAPRAAQTGRLGGRLAPAVDVVAGAVGAGAAGATLDQLQGAGLDQLGCLVARGLRGRADFNNGRRFDEELRRGHKGILLQEKCLPTREPARPTQPHWVAHETPWI